MLTGLYPKARDVLLSFSGLENMRMLDDHECDIPPIVVDDWEDEIIPERHASILSPVTEQQKLYFVEYCKLAALGECDVSNNLCHYSLLTKF